MKKLSLIGILFALLGVGVIALALTRANLFAGLLSEASSDIKTVEYDKVDASREGHLVAVSGQLTADGKLTDSVFGVSRKTVMLKRVVEVYQWQKNCDDGCKYEKTWHEGLIRSDGFESGHENPASTKYESQEFIAENQTFGAYSLPEALIHKLSYDTTLGPDEISELYSGDLKIFNEYLTNSANPAEPAIGDYRISYRYVKDKIITIVAKQVNNSFEEYHSSNKETLFEIDEGSETAEDFIKHMSGNNRDVNWILVGIGVTLLIIGILSIVSKTHNMGKK